MAYSVALHSALLHRGHSQRIGGRWLYPRAYFPKFFWLIFGRWIDLFGFIRRPTISLNSNNNELSSASYPLRVRCYQSSSLRCYCGQWRRWCLFWWPTPISSCHTGRVLLKTMLSWERRSYFFSLWLLFCRLWDLQGVFIIDGTHFGVCIALVFIFELLILPSSNSPVLRYVNIRVILCMLAYTTSVEYSVVSYVLSANRLNAQDSSHYKRRCYWNWIIFKGNATIIMHC